MCINLQIRKTLNRGYSEKATINEYRLPQPPKAGMTHHIKTYPTYAKERLTGHICANTAKEVPSRNSHSNRGSYVYILCDQWVHSGYLENRILLKPVLGAYTASQTLCSQTSMARTSFGPWHFVRDIGSSSHWGLIIAPGQEANADNLGMYIFYTFRWAILMSTHNIQHTFHAAK